MNDTLINLPKENVEVNRYRTGAATAALEGVRVFRIMPERVAMQIRGAKYYATVSLPLAQLDELIAALQEGRKEIAQ